MLLSQNELVTASHRQEQPAGYLLVRDNPVICAGVFPYLGSQLPDAPEPTRVYQVYRPLEELTKPETLESFKGLPLLAGHEMVGDNYERGAEERGCHGAILDDLKVVGNNILASISIFSRTLKAMVEAGTKGLSMGYRCRFEKAIGEYEGKVYSYIQREILGNHLALVSQGRNGTEVLDSSDVFDEFDLNLQESTMAETEKKPETEKKEGDGAEAMSLEKVHGFMKTNAPMWHELQALMAGEGDDKDKKTALDADEDEKKKKAEDADKDDKDCAKDADKDDKKEKKEDAMDSAAVTALMDAKFSDFRKSAVKSLAADISARDKLAKRLEPHTGTFACDAMDAAEVAEYGAKKLGISGGIEAVNAYLTAAEKFKTNATFAMDSGFNSKPKAGGKLAATLEKAS